MFGMRAAVVAAGLAAMVAAGGMARADSIPASSFLRSFGKAKAVSAYEFSPVGTVGFALEQEVNVRYGDSTAKLVRAAYGLPPAFDWSRFAGSTVLDPHWALDVGHGVDVAERFTGADLPFLSPVNAPFMGLANGGDYAGLTFLPTSALRIRLGAALNNERLNQPSLFNPMSITTPLLGLAYEPSQTQSLLGGVSWDILGDTGVDVNAIAATRSGIPLGLAQTASIAPRASTQAISVSAHLGLGSGWVTTASFSGGLSQLDLRGGTVNETREQSYSLAITKHGLFGDDSLGFSLSQPAPSMAGTFASLLDGSDTLPPLVVGRGQSLADRPETDFQLGYVTNFLGGAVALQTNAAYQMNIQGKSGASSLSLLSRAKIKF